MKSHLCLVGVIVKKIPICFVKSDICRPKFMYCYSVIREYELEIEYQAFRGIYIFKD